MNTINRAKVAGIVVVRQDDELTLVELEGRLDIQGVEQLDLIFTSNIVTRRKPAIVDISKIEYLASLGLRMLLSVSKALSAHGAKLVVLNPQPLVEEVFTKAGFDKIIPITHDLDTALNLLKDE